MKIKIKDKNGFILLLVWLSFIVIGVLYRFGIIYKGVA